MLKNPKLAKTVVSSASSLLFALALGYTYKLSKWAGEQIDAHYDAQTEPESDAQDN